MDDYDPQKDAHDSYYAAIEAKRARGDHLYKRKEVIGDCTLYLGDCMDIMPMIGKVDAVVTDPPYGVGVDYNEFDDTQDNLAELAATWLPIALSISDRVVHTPGNINMHHYSKPTWTMAWVTPAGAGSGPWGFSCWQPIMCYGKDPWLTHGKGRGHDIIMHTETSEKNGHPCPKPIKFMRKLLHRVTMPNEVVLDPFMGSGSTGVSCVQTGRRFVGIELDEKYFDIACERIQDACNRPDMFIHSERQKKEKQETLL